VVERTHSGQRDVRTCGNEAGLVRTPVPQNKRMKLTSLSTAPGQMEAPSRAPQGKREGRTGSQLIRGVRRTRRPAGAVV
jgi:hypothetical protein